MAPPRTRPAKPGDSRDFKVRLPENVAARIAAKAKAENRAMNRVIINELMRFPDIEPQAALADRVSDLETLLARYASRITWLELNERLLDAVDAVLSGSAPAALDRLRVARAGFAPRRDAPATFEELGTIAKQTFDIAT